MATIPEPGAPSVAPSAMPTPYGSTAGVTPDAFGAPLGRLLQNDVAPTAEAIYLREKRKADESATTAALGQGQQALNAITDPATGYFSLKGYDALAAKQKTIEEFDKSLAKINTSLNHDQQLLFAHPAAMLRNEALHHIQSHEGQQIHVADAANTKGAVDALSRSLQTPAIASDPNEVEYTMAKLKGTLTSGAQRQLGESATADAIASLVGPGMQKGAMDAMNGALATESPAVATAVYQKVGQYLGEHEHTYGNFVRSLAAKQQIATESGSLIAAGATQVAMPDGTLLPRIDGAKVAAKLATKAPETPNLAEIAKAADQKEKVLADLWNKSVAVVADRVHSAGQNPVTGDFNYQSDKIDPKDKAWLSQFAPGEVDKLRALEVKATSRDSRANYSEALSNIYDPAQKQGFQQMTMEEFKSYLRDTTLFPGGLAPQDSAKLVTKFAVLQKQNFDEKIGATVKEELRKAFSGDTEAQDARFGELQDRANAFAQQYQTDQGKVPKTEEIRAYVVKQLAQEPGTGLFGTSFGAKRRIDLPRQAATPPVAAATPVAPTPPTVKTQADYDALPPGTRYIGPDGLPATKRGR